MGALGLGLGGLRGPAGASGGAVVTTRGDVLRGGVGGAAERLPLGAAGQVLTSDGTDLVWAAASGGGASGPERDRPAPGTAGATYRATDSGITWADDGTTWRVQGTGAPDTLTLTGWGGGTYLTSDEAVTTQSGAVPCTVIAAFYLGTLPAGAQRLLWTITEVGARGWQVALTAPTANRIAWYGYGFSAEVEIPSDLGLGWHVAAFAISDAGGGNTLIRYALDGVAGSATVTGTYVPPLSGDRCRIGAAANASVPLQYDTGLAGLVYLSSALSQAELEAITATPSSGRIVTPAGHVETFGLRASRVGWLRAAGDVVFTSGTEPRALTVTGTVIPVVR